MTLVLQSPRCIIDFETRSECDLLACGARRYAEDESTRILCMGYSFDHGITTGLWTPWVLGEEEREVEVVTGKGKNKVVTKSVERYPAMVYRPEECPFPKEVVDFVLAGGALEGHSVGMERSHWRQILVKQFGLPDCKRWIDTQASCAYRALPLSLDEVGEVLNLDIKKDKAGRMILSRISKPRKPTKFDKRKWDNDPQLFQDCFEYCRQDVRAEGNLGQRIGDLTPSEYRMWVLDQVMNERGVRIDMNAVCAAKSVAEQATVNMEAELVEMTSGEITTGNQRDRMIEWLWREHKIRMPDMTASTVKETLKDKGIPPFEKGKKETFARRVLEIRQELSRTSTKKLYSMLACVCRSGRIHGLLQYHGAGTGRWAGRLVQPQNFPRPKIMGKPFKGDIEELIGIILFEDIAVIRLCFGPEMEAIAASLRGMFIAEDGCDYCVADFSSIEARIVMWLAGQDDAMEVFEKADAKTGPDIYCHLAGAIYGRIITKADADERQLGKIGVLGAGYGMGAAALQTQAHDEYELDLELALCQRIISTYRETYPKVKQFWYDIERAACTAVQQNKAVRHRCIVFEPITDAAGKWLTARLPSGRLLWYFNPSITMEPVPWSTAEKPDIRPKLWYEGRDNKRGGVWTLISTYGGMLTENLVQAIARDVMAEAMVRAELAGYPLILTVHDEIISEQPKTHGTTVVTEKGLVYDPAYEKLVAQPPLWLEGMPIAVEGWRGPRYKKG